MLAGLACLTEEARADQGGVSFWLPGAFGSLAATPLVPGWALGAIYIHSSVSAGALDEASAKGWAVVTMKDDWKRIFAFEGKQSGPHSSEE